MSINGINNSLLASLGTVSRPDVSRPQTDRAPANGGATNGAGRAPTAPTARPALRAQTPIAGQNTTQSAVPMDAPAGTDPALWSVLTSEERNFFAKSATQGPLTYSRIKDASHPATPVARGVRLDVRA